MIHVFFVPGMFGSTIEHVLTDYTQEFEPTGAKLLPDGSMHSFDKQNHPWNLAGLENQVKEINTPIYPFNDATFEQILQRYSFGADDKCILIYADCNNDAELNLLFQYYKIAVGSKLKNGLQKFLGGVDKQNLMQWNPNYQNFDDLAPWEFREWFSLFYHEFVQDWQRSKYQISDNWLKIKNTSVLYDTAHTFKQIISHCGLTAKTELDQFVIEWQNAQQYIVNEFNLIEQIVTSAIDQVPLTWSPISPVAEAIVQNRLRTKGFELRCHDLNIFPTNSIDLYNLLDSSLQLHKQGD